MEFIYRRRKERIVSSKDKLYIKHFSKEWFMYECDLNRLLINEMYK